MYGGEESLKVAVELHGKSYGRGGDNKKYCGGIYV